MGPDRSFVDPGTDSRTDPGSSDRCGTVGASGWIDTELSVRLRRGAGGTVRVDGTMCSAPVWFRWDGSTLWMVGSGASPVGEDHIRVRLDVGPGVTASVRSVAATVALAARGVGTRWQTEIDVGEGARLDWRPEPLILTGRARHATTTRVHAAAGAEVTIDEVIVLGRFGEPAGLLRSTLDVRIDERPVLLTSTDTSLPGWAGPAGIDGAGCLATRLHLGVPPADGTLGRVARGALLSPADGCRLALSAADSVSAARGDLNVLLPR